MAVDPEEVARWVAEWEEQARKRTQLFEEKGPTSILLLRAATPRPSDNSLSYLGGLPRLPPDAKWPTVPLANGDAPLSMSFVAQIDLSDVPDGPGRQLLPKSGTLYFFFDTQLSVQEEIWCKVLYHPSTSADFPERPAPGNMMRLGPWDEKKRPWLADDDPHACIAFKYALSFTRKFPDKCKEEYVRPDWGPTKSYPTPEGGVRVVRELEGVMLVGWPYAPIYYETLRRGILIVAGRSRERYDRQPWHWFEELMALARSLPEISSKDPFRPCTNEERSTAREAVHRFMTATKGRFVDEGVAFNSFTVTDLLKQTCFYCTSRGFSEGRLDEHADEGRLLQGMEAAADEWRSCLYIPYMMLGIGSPVQNAFEKHLEDVLLLQVTSEDKLNWSSRCGAIQYWIKKADLAALNFDNVLATSEWS